MSRRLIPKLVCVSVFGLCLFLAGSLAAQDTDVKYMTPPKVLADVVDAPYTPSLSISPDRQTTLFLTRPGRPGIDEVAQPELRLAGLRLNPRNNGPSRQYYFNSVTVRAVEGGEERPVTGLPNNPKINHVRWAPDSKHVAFMVTLPDHLELWVMDVKKAEARRVAPIIINDAYSNTYSWVSDNKTLIAVAIPDGRGEAPKDPAVPDGPTVQENLGRTTPARTYQDLLKNAHDEAVFEYYATAQIVRVTLDGKVTKLGKPGLIDDANPSPDGKYILVTRTHRPYSYTVPSGRFPKLTEVWDMAGKVVHQVVDQPLADNIPIPYGSVQTGRREIGWRADADATLYWAEALDGGDAGAEADFRDAIYLLPAPFTGDPILLFQTETRYGDVTWCRDDLALISQWWWPTRKIKVWHSNRANPMPNRDWCRIAVGRTGTTIPANR